MLEVKLLEVSFSVPIIFSKAVEAVSGSRTYENVSVPSSVALVDDEYRLVEYKVLVSFTRAVVGIVGLPVTTE